MKRHQKFWVMSVVVQTLLPIVLSGGPAAAEMRTITATGEYRMGDNDTRTDAKRLALLDAKRLALEQAGTYIESITQVKNFELSNEEIRAYTAGIVEVVEQASRDTMEGATHVIRVDVTAKIETDVVTRQIDALRKNESAKVELLKLRLERDQLKQEIEATTRQLATLNSKTEVETVTKQRQQAVTRLEVEDLLGRADRALLDYMLFKSREIPVTEKTRILREEETRISRLVEQVLAIDPANAEAHKKKGLLLGEQGKHEDAVLEYRTVLRLKPDDRDTHLFLGESLKEGGDLDGAIAVYRAGIRLKPDDSIQTVPLRISLAQALWRKGDLEGAIAEHREIIRINPRAAISHVFIGNILLAREDYNGVIAELRAAVRINPDIEEAHENLGFAFLRTGELEEAITELRTSIRLMPNNSWPRYNLALALERKGLKKAAAQELREVLKLESATTVGRARSGALNVRGRIRDLER